MAGGGEDYSDVASCAEQSGSGPPQQDCCKTSLVSKKMRHTNIGPEFLCSDFFLLFEKDTTMVAPPDSADHTGLEEENPLLEGGNSNSIYASPSLASELRADNHLVDAAVLEEHNRTSATTRTEKSTTIYCRTKLRRFLKQNATIVFLYLLPEFHNMLSNKLIPMLLDENSKLELIIAWWLSNAKTSGSGTKQLVMLSLKANKIICIA